ncbi:hypothetical protein [Myroides odoratus]|uniref:hypothetical protein n=1 Tax=Myroides odoratus TaxID=256 RepID=UPI0039B04145
MGKIILLIGLFSLTIGLSQNKKSSVYFEILEEEIRDSTWLEIKLVNNSNQNIWIALDTISENQTRLQFCKTELCGGIKIRENLKSQEKDTPIYTIVSTSAHDLEYFNQINGSIQDKDRIVLIPKNKILVIPYFFTLKKVQELNNQSFIEYDLSETKHKQSKITFDINYIMSKKWMDKYVGKELLLELKSKKYSPYNEYIRSNTVKFVY